MQTIFNQEKAQDVTQKNTDQMQCREGSESSEGGPPIPVLTPVTILIPIPIQRRKGVHQLGQNRKTRFSHVQVACKTVDLMMMMLLCREGRESCPIPIQIPTTILIPIQIPLPISIQRREGMHQLAQIR
jgi:hypothetical protein